MKRTSTRNLSLVLALVFFITSFLSIPARAQCTHTKCTDYWSWSEFVNHNQTKHRIKHYYDRICDDCGIRVKVVNNFEWAQHELSGNKCDCGYEYICKHKKCKDYWSWSEYVSYNQTQHRIKHYYERICSECGEYVKEVSNYKWAKHEVYDNKCECGYEYVCRHGTYQDILTSTEYTGKVNKSQHQVEKVSNRVCSKCNEFLKNISNTKWEKHNFVEGKCECGYEDTSKAVIDITSYNITLDKNNKYVTINVQASKDVAKVDIYLRNSKVIDSLDVNGPNAEAKFTIPYSDKEEKYTVGIVVFDKNMSNSKTIKESIVVNNSQSWWDRLSQVTSNMGHMTLGVLNGIIDTVIIEPSKMVIEFLDWGLNAFDEEMYEHNKVWRDNLYSELEGIIDDNLSDEQAYYYYWGTFGGKTADLVVGGVYTFQGLRGIINSISMTKGGIRVLEVTLDTGDEAVAMLSSDVDDVAMLAPKLKGIESLSTRDELLTFATNDKLKNCIKEMYRNGATIGDGGLADAIRYEISTGELVGGKSHIQKGIERIKNLENILQKQSLNSKDIDIATKLLNDLKDALTLGGYY